MPYRRYCFHSAVVLASVLCGLSAAQEKPDSSQDKPPALTLVIEGDIDAKLAPVVGRLTTLFYESYPKLLARFEHPNKPAPRRILIRFERKLEVPAHCSGDRLTISIDWMTKHPDDIGLLTHELTHAVQQYPKSDPGWLTEGIADYARHLYGPQPQPGWELPKRLTDRQSYTNSYRVTARFLLWLDEAYPGSVDKLHGRMQEQKFKLDDFKTATGKDVDTLWKECVESFNRRRNNGPQG